MTKCLATKEFNGLNSLDQDALLSFYMKYDQSVRTYPECADADNYLNLSEALLRVTNNTLSGTALGKALWASMRMWQNNDATNQQFVRAWSASTYDRSSVIRLIKSNLSTGNKIQQSSGDWKTIPCAKNLSACSEMSQEETAFNQHLKNYLLRTLYARLFSLNSVPLEVGFWISAPITKGAWQREPLDVLEVLNQFIDVQKIVLGNRSIDKIGNTVIILRDLLEMTAKAGEGGIIHLPPKTFAKYYDKDKQLLPSIGQGVAIYLIFLQSVPHSALPDKTMLAALTTMSDNKRSAKELERLVLERLKNVEESK